MKSYIDRIKNLDVVYYKNLAMVLVLGSLISYDNFIMSFHLNSMDKKIMELYNLLQTTKADIKKVVPTNQVLTIQSGGRLKRKRSNPKWKERQWLDIPKVGIRLKEMEDTHPRVIPKMHCAFTMASTSIRNEASPST